MIDTATPTRAEIAAQLWRWLPGVYRARDVDGQLAALLGVFADELWRVRRTIEQQHADHFIDSAQDWVIPYLADLVGTSVLYTGSAGQQREIAARNRADVKNTLLRQRQKGTLAGLEAAAHDAGGFGVHATEMFERCCWLQNRVHLKPQAVFALDLRRGEAVAAAVTPFSRARALVDLRPATQRHGWHRVDQLLVHTWPIASHPWVAVTPSAAQAPGGGRWRFHPLGIDCALHAGGATAALRAQVAARTGAAGADILQPNAADTPIRRADLRAHAAAYVDSGLGFAIREDGIALVGGEPAGAPSTRPALDWIELADNRGLVPADTGAYPPGMQAELAAVRLGAVLQLVDGAMAPIASTPGRPWASQFQLRNPQGRLALDTVVPDFGYTAGVAPYQSDAGEFHHPALLLRISNQGAAALAMPASELILRNARGLALQVFLPALPALAPGAQQFVYAADDGSTYHARADHAPGTPDRNPDSSLFGAFAAAHLARASEGQRRIRPGHPAGAQRWRRVVARQLCCWDQPLQPPLAAGEVGVDPERGRFAFAAGEEPAGALSVDFRVGLTHTVGAGPYARPGLASATIRVAQTRNADFATLQDAIDAAPDGGALPVVIEVLDSAVYAEALVVDGRSFPGGLTIQAAPLQTPFVTMAAAATHLLHVHDSAISALLLDGLVLGGGTVQVDAGVGASTLHQCTLVPADTSLAIAAGSLQMHNCISGPVVLGAAAGAATFTDCAVQHPAASVEAPTGVSAVTHAGGTVALDRCTVVGDLVAASASLSNSLLWGALQLGAAGCLRFSRFSRVSGSPASDTAPAFRCTSATPIFVSLRWGDAGYLHLHPNTAAALLRGGEEGGEVGVFHGAGLPWRAQAVGLRLAEHTPAGLRAVQVRALTAPRNP